MKLLLKKRVLAAGLIGFSLWPLAQLELVRRFRISPWKLAGWGMYSTPRISPGLGVLVERANEAPSPMRVVPPEVRAAGENFVSRRLWLGDLAPPDAFAAVVLASSPDYDRATIQIIETRLDIESGMVRAVEKRYRYERGAGASRR